MSRLEWRQAWVDELIAAGMLRDTAIYLFNVCYGNQEIDLDCDPRQAAQTFIVH
ncbi:hypothetical protein [uncultured Oxalicibacterium sp.]|uniref:hypothetical protein n=1 Tax=uncultured Oxalicibacterium sp. TaxID=1168540 RepID=UPI0025EC3C6F|nr:hypothetical protein [uncultured Oxalicibacterium sp.]